MFKLEKKRFQINADFHELFQTVEDDRAKAVGQSKMSIEQADRKLDVTKKLIAKFFGRV